MKQMIISDEDFEVRRNILIEGYKENSGYSREQRRSMAIGMMNGAISVKSNNELAFTQRQLKILFDDLNEYNE